MLKKLIWIWECIWFIEKSSIWSSNWLTFFFTETSTADNSPICIVQASWLSFIFDLKFQKCRFHKYMRFLNLFYPLEFTNTPYFLISKIWRPPSLVHLFCTPLYLAVETALKKNHLDMRVHRIYWKKFYLVFDLIDLLLYGNLYCRQSLHIYCCSAPCISSFFDWEFIKCRFYK